MILQETLMWIVEAIVKACSLSKNVLCHCYVSYIYVPSNLGIFVLVVQQYTQHCHLWGYGTIGSIRLQWLLWWCWFFSNRLWAFESLPGSYCLYNNIVSPRRFIKVFFFFLLDDKYNHTTSVFYSIELNIIGKSQPACTSARWILMST